MSFSYSPFLGYFRKNKNKNACSQENIARFFLLGESIYLLA